MMRVLVLLFMLIGSFGGWSKPINPATEHYLAGFLATSERVPGSEEMFMRHLNSLQDKRAKFRSDLDFVRYVFSATHKKFLKTFDAQATFGVLFKNGAYSCLTGTILYSLILSDFDIPHQVIETNYHIFILVKTETGELLLEATDPANGLVTGDNEITRRMEVYRSTTPTMVKPKGDLSYYEFSFDLFNRVTLEELAGLLYYNLAIEAYNKQNLAEAIFYLDEAIARYSSPRIEEMARLLLLTVHESSLNASEKSAFKKTLQTIRYRALPVVAGLRP
ncbi:MAG: hypothetical protein ACK4RF_10265 [Cyclobacteriaceae bacterium]